MTMTLENFMKKPQERCDCDPDDPDCEHESGEESDALIGNKGPEKVFPKGKNGFISQLDFATTRRPKKFLRPVDVSSLGGRKGKK